MRAARYFLGGVVVLAVIIVAAYLVRLPIAGFAVRSAMAGAGLENPNAVVTNLTPSRIALRDVAAGAAGGEGFAFEEVEARYNLSAFVSQRRVEAVQIGSGAVRLSVTEDGDVVMPGLPNKGGGDRGALPFAQLSVANTSLLIATPEGDVQGTISADYNAATGGGAVIHLETDHAGAVEARFDNASLSTELKLSEDGGTTFSGGITGDVISSGMVFRDVDAAIHGQASSWRDVLAGVRDNLVGTMRVEIHSASADFDSMLNAASVKREQAELIFGGPVSTLSLTAGLNIVLSGEGVTAAIGDTPFVIRADNGAQLLISELPGDFFLKRAGDKRKASFSFDVSGAPVTANGTVNAEKNTDGWFAVAPVRIGAFHSERFSMDGASMLVRIQQTEDGVAADVTTTAALREASIGRFSVLDAPLETNLRIDANYAAKIATVTLPEDHCVTLSDALVMIAQQDTEALLKDARLCSADKPLAIINWNSDLQSAFAGKLSASNLRYRLGRTRIVGRAPVITVSGLYQPALNLTNATGAIAGGAMVLNNMLRFSSAEGTFDFSLDSQQMRSSMDVSSVRITQYEETPKMAPVYGSGEGELIGKDADFSYVLRTPTGHRLGQGTGKHNVSTARGASVFTFDRVEFAPDGLQPEALAPVLSGFIGATIGEATGEAKFEWAPLPAGLSSSAALQFENVTFEGPTRIVDATIGLNGDIELADLWPVKTNGVQKITVAGVDLGALQLQEGEIRFELPGDETLRVEEALFPWFGGVLGVSNANATIAGGEAVAPLRADNIDLGLVLEYVDVDGLSGEGVLSGVLPLVVEDGKARIENGVLKSQGPGAVRYQGQAAQQAAVAGDDAQVAFDILRDLQFTDLGVTVNGPLDGRLQFNMMFEGTGEVALNAQNVRVPVLYRITLDAAILDLLQQMNLSRDIQLQVERGLQGEQ